MDIVLHAGDLISPFTAPRFEKLKMRFEAVFGNNDGEKDGLRKAFNKLCDLSDFKIINFEGLKIALLHGTDERIVKCILKSGEFDVVVRGHTHEAKIDEVNNTLLINPGETCGYVSGKKTIAILDPDTLKPKIIELE